jgi:hypothetical protein
MLWCDATITINLAQCVLRNYRLDIIFESLLLPANDALAPSALGQATPMMNAKVRRWIFFQWLFNVTRYTFSYFSRMSQCSIGLKRAQANSLQLVRGRAAA